MFRCACMIDGGYLNKILDSYGRVKLKHHDFAIQLSNGIDILRTYFYHCPPFVGPTPTPEESERQRKFDSFSSSLQKLPHFECRLGRLEKRTAPDGTVKFEQKRVDVMLATDIATLSAKRLVTHINLVAGDSDLIPAIQIAKNEGVIVNLFHGPIHTVHDQLLQTVDNRIMIDAALISACKV